MRAPQPKGGTLPTPNTPTSSFFYASIAAKRQAQSNTAAPRCLPPYNGETRMSFDEAPLNPADIAVLTESAPARRKQNARDGARRAADKGNKIAGGQGRCATHSATAASAAIADCHGTLDTHSAGAVGNTFTSDAAPTSPRPTFAPPHAGIQSEGGGHRGIAIHSSSAPAFRTNPAHHDAINKIIEYSRLRTDMIRARTKLILQAQAFLRRMFNGDKEMASRVFREAAIDKAHQFRPVIQVYLGALELFEKQQAEFEKRMVRAMKPLPILRWARDIKGFGDMSLACIIGEASGAHSETGEFYSVGDFKSVSALWKRMGLAVLNGRRQGNPGEGAGKADWILHAYSKARRSLMWNVGNSLILSMGKFRPLFGEDVDANPGYTYLQKVFANRARYEAARLPHKDGTPIKSSTSGKDSYSAHAANRAKRYTEKRLLRMLFSEWRRCMA